MRSSLARWAVNSSDPPSYRCRRIALRLAFGQMADEALLASARVFPQKLMAAGFQFTHPTVDKALAAAPETQTLAAENLLPAALHYPRAVLLLFFCARRAAMACISLPILDWLIPTWMARLMMLPVIQ